MNTWSKTMMGAAAAALVVSAAAGPAVGAEDPGDSRTGSTETQQSLSNGILRGVSGS